ncbi:MAG: hypothetical protein COV74_02735 [Candidatus Omnitrophica bacterium CG11_big_fil_rev_8_21_14_0_20_45_26]|uniref:Type 4 fimbrial biogenesis protein PilX N-terminal domain-containing protein n=1 Tax=Candidatus Abzuiibacterium crystallinum TaxID=1974748 RepID=A0A2H0LRF1_9BACT|nr:MAG: hypothetical protein COV74_02735 [Candidatus Omnitrophica bacterium CG11_big_fil_rev_8_21_14_0_20_45_26]PIW65562.1 MAG: hypothetical protein COW12_01185 [Candidatus Omnitrophica bacterium CG12_big_fil_rev_8_21_14_0_65_45_16]
MNPIDSFKSLGSGPGPDPRKKGVSLIAAVVLMLLLGLSGAIGSAIVANAGIRTVHTAQSLQALGIAHAGIEWYLEQLEDDTDWTDQTNEVRLFGPPSTVSSFTIQINNASATEVNFTSLGLLAGLDGRTMQRRLTVTAQKMPSAFLFALYQGEDPGANLEIRNSSVVTGDMWSRGSVNVFSGNTVQNGLVYVPDTETVSGAGTFTAKQMTAPYPAMPQITTTSYTTLMDGYDTTIDTASGAGDDPRNSDIFLSGNTILARNFSTSGTMTITGHGTIVAFRNMDLHTGNGGTLTITPSGGDIVFLAGRNLEIGNTNGNSTVTVNGSVTPGSTCRFYSEAMTNASQRVRVSGSNTNVHGANFYARRRISVDNNAVIDQGSLLYIDRASSANNNQIDITGSATAVIGSVISTGRNNLNLRIRNQATVTGLVYSYDTGGNGRLELNNCTVTGAAAAQNFRVGNNNNRIQSAAVTYSASALPSSVPNGFETYVVKKPNSWDPL